MGLGRLIFHRLIELTNENTLFWAKARQPASSKEYVPELFSSSEQRIFRNSVVHIYWAKADFCENVISKTVVQRSKLKWAAKKESTFWWQVCLG